MTPAPDRPSATPLPTNPDVVIVGAGAAGLAAAENLRQAGVPCVVLEARQRVGGRAWTRTDLPYPQDLGCGWLHSGDRNPFTAIAESLGFAVDRTPAPWERRTRLGFAEGEADDFATASAAFYERLEQAADEDRPASAFLEPGQRWNGLLDAVSTYVNGVELAGLSVVDFDRYDDSGVNWRVPDGYGTLISRYGHRAPVALGCPVSGIDISGSSVVVETPRGTVRAQAAIVTVPTDVLASGAIMFRPGLPAVMDAAATLPLGLADKLVLFVDKSDDLPVDQGCMGRTDTVRTASYHIRPFGRPVIESYFGGTLAADLERGGQAAFVEHAATELVGLFGEAIRDRITPLACSAWLSDPFALGSYSHARPGHADARSVLATPVQDRLVFAGEATSLHDFSTAHGAYRSGVAAAQHVLDQLGWPAHKKAGATP